VDIEESMAEVICRLHLLRRNVRYIRLMSSQIRLSSVTFVQPTQTVELFGNILHHLTA